MGCVQTLERNNKLCIQFKDNHMKDMSNCFLTLTLAKEEIRKEGEEIILNLPPKGEGGLLIIDGGAVIEEGGTYCNGI